MAKDVLAGLYMLYYRKKVYERLLGGQFPLFWEMYIIEGPSFVMFIDTMNAILPGL